MNPNNPSEFKFKRVEENESEVSDRVGILFSVLCCLHCMAIPALIIFAPAIGQYFKNPYVHLISMAVVIPIGFYAFISKLKVHHNKKPLYIGVVGMIFLVAGHSFHTLLANEMGEFLEIGASVIGGVSLVWAHLLNIKLCRCNSCHH